MDPTVWGPHYWMFLHSVAAHYPKHPNGISKKVHYRLFHNFHEFIPNNNVARNFRRLLEMYPITPYLDSRARLVEWVHFIHNKVNEHLGKPTITLEQHRDNMHELYFSKSKRWNRYVKNNFLVVSFVFIVLIAVVVYAYS